MERGYEWVNPGGPGCERKLGSLTCTREANHQPGCVFVASDATDRHALTSGE